MISMYVTGMEPLKEEQRVEMVRYLKNRADEEKGGWGMYVLSFSFPLSLFHPFLWRGF